jgi:hypothetical protein
LSGQEIISWVSDRLGMTVMMLASIFLVLEGPTSSATNRSMVALGVAAEVDNPAWRATAPRKERRRIEEAMTVLFGLFVRTEEFVGKA